MKEIRNITVENIVGGRMAGAPAPDEVHKKALPCLTVGQVVHGSLGLALDGEEVQSTGEMGVFIAPAGRVQNWLFFPKDGVVKIHWAYMNVQIDGAPLGDTLSLPAVLPRAASGQIYAAIRAICEEGVLARRYIAAYRILDSLLSQATAHTPEEEERRALRRFVDAHHGDEIGAPELAAALSCSPTQIYRYTARFFGMSPSHYINHVRLQHVALELERTDRPVRTIALAAGFSDIPYFTRLFKRAFLLPPGEYRARCLRWNTGRI